MSHIGSAAAWAVVLAATCAVRGEGPPKGDKDIRIGPDGVEVRFAGRADGRAVVERDIVVHEPDRKLRIRETRDGLEMTVTRTKDGKEEVQTFKAKTPDDLRAAHPEEYKLYQRYMAGGVFADAAAPRFHLQVRPPDLRAWMPSPPAFEEDRRAADQKLREIEESVKKLGAPGEPVLKQLAEYRERQKKMWHAMGLPAAPPRPPLGAELLPADDVLRAQLGIEGGAVITRVYPAGRGEKMGLKANDVVAKANGKPVKGIDAFRRTIVEEKLTLDIYRAGKPMALEEKE